MTDRDSFFAAICADPDEDTPRLAFADWLDERGTKADQFQADYIRTAVGFARAEPWSAEWLVFREHSAKLSHKIPAAWTAHLKGRVIAPAFERGFVGHVTMYSKRFVAEGEKLFAQDPIRTLKFATLKAARGAVSAAELFRCPHLARAARLVIEGSGLKDKELTALAASPHTANLRALWLGSDNPFPRASLPKLLAARPGITELNLVHNRDVTDGHAKALADSPAFAHLTHLNLAHAGVTAVGIAALVKSKHAANLRELLVAPMYEYDEEHGHSFGTGGSRADGLATAKALAAATLPNLVELDLRERKLGNDGVAELAQARGLPSLRRLVLSENGVTKKGVEVLAKTPLGQQLRFLDLSGNGSLVQHEVAVKEMFPGAHVRVNFELL